MQSYRQWGGKPPLNFDIPQVYRSAPWPVSFEDGGLADRRQWPLLLLVSEMVVKLYGYSHELIQVAESGSEGERTDGMLPAGLVCSIHQLPRSRSPLHTRPPSELLDGSRTDIRYQYRHGLGGQKPF